MPDRLMLVDKKSLSEIDQKVRAELVELLFRQISKSAIAANIVAILVVVGLFKTINIYLLLGWYIANFCFSPLWQNILTYRYKHRAPDDQRASYWINWFFIGVLFAGCNWSLVGIYLLPSQPFNYQAFLIIFMLGMASAANTAFSFIRTAYIIYATIMLLPLAIWLLLQGSILYMLIGAGVVIFNGVLIGTCFNNHRLITDALRLRFEKKELQDAKQKLEILNDDLSVEITRREKIEAMLEHLTTHDTLTGLPNRALFQDKLSQSFSKAAEKMKMVGILFIDLDNFKKINDTLGHNLGDQVLTRVGSMFQTLLRETDLIARLGGDEFTITIDSVNELESIESVAKKICAAFTNGIQIDKQTIYITTSIGISIYPSDGVDILTLIKNADIALYHAKACGKNNYQFYTDELEAKITRRQILENDLHNAIANQEFEIYYQPLVDLATDKIVGAEALIRWHHPRDGLTMPVKFIDFAEESGLIVTLGDWVLREACMQCKAWQANYPEFFISVNVSPKQVSTGNFCDRTHSILQETKLAGHHLDLEITESLLIHDIEFALKIIINLKKLGIIISLDDFGTGYSSLNYLKRFPIDKLKIDRSFIKGIPNDISDVAITKVVLSLGRSLNLAVTAEGVESIEQYNFVKSNKCTIIQGYYISHPLNARDFSDFMQNYKKQVNQ